MHRTIRDAVLLLRARGRTCALPLEHVLETMRALPVTPLAGVPACVRGASVVRGAAVPVVDLGALLSGDAPAAPARLVLVRCGERAAALAVDEVLGVGRLDASAAAPAPLLSGGAVEALGARDRELLVVLSAARLVPDDAWRAIARREGAP